MENTTAILFIPLFNRLSDIINRRIEIRFNGDDLNFEYTFDYKDAIFEIQRNLLAHDFIDVIRFAERALQEVHNIIEKDIRDYTEDSDWGQFPQQKDELIKEIQAVVNDELNFYNEYLNEFIDKCKRFSARNEEKNELKNET